MPGTIQVSILGLVGLPSSLQSSSLSIKVSVGKQTYETMDKGDISFPLASLRDNLNVWIYDFEGNVIAHTVVETRSIVEKGVWDDLFALNSGGHVRMKLHFNLTEHELNRIRSMRESASRKKQEDILRRSRSGSDLTVASGGSPISSQDPPKTVHEAEDRGVTLANTQATEPSSASDAEVRSKASNDRKKQALPTSFSAGALDKLPIRQSVNKVANPQYQESHSPSGKIPSNVKKMILAFESPVKEEVPATGKSTEAPQISNITVVEEHSDSLRSKKKVTIDVKPVFYNLETVPANPSMAVGMDEKSGEIRNFEDPFDEILGHRTNDGMPTNDSLSKIKPVLCTPSLSEGTDKERGEKRELKDSFQEHVGKTSEKVKEPTVQNTDQMDPNKEDHRDEKNSVKKSRRSSTYERTKLSWTMIAREFPSQTHVSNELVTKLKWRSKQWKTSQLRVKYQGSHWNTHFLNSFRGWVFLDETICSCTPVDSKSFVDVLEDCYCNTETSEGKPMDRDVQKIEDSNKPDHPKILDSAKSPNKGAPKRPAGQAIKIAIMVGFGLLVFFTRQRK